MNTVRPHNAPGRLLIARTDRIGDVILSLPVAAAIKRAWPSCTVDFLIQGMVMPVIDMSPHVDGFVAVDPFIKHGVVDAIALGEQLASRRYDAAVCLYPRPQIARALKRAAIPIRIGTSRRWYSRRFNRRVPVRRAGSGRHESALNGDLLAPLGINVSDMESPRLVPTHTDHARVATILDTVHLNDTDGQRLIAIHPGCGGSAANWPIASYAALSRCLADKGCVPIWTGSEAEQAAVRAALDTGQPHAVSLAGLTDLPTLAALFQRCCTVVAPSTGPLHLAAAVGTTVVGLYGPIENTEPARWGPRGEGHHVLIPEVPACRCKVGQCKMGDCMERITVESVTEAVEDIVRRTANIEIPLVAPSGAVRIARHASGAQGKGPTRQ